MNRTGSGTASGAFFAPGISSDGSLVAFSSAAWDLADGDYNGLPGVFAFPVPQITPVLRLSLLPFGEGGSPALVWRAVPGQQARVQYQNSLPLGAWFDLPGVPVMHGPSVLLLEDVSPDRGPQRFYRLFIEK